MNPRTHRTVEADLLRLVGQTFPKTEISMPLAELFWWLLTYSTVGWYLSVTVYVAYRGVVDIRQMLRRLADDQPMSHRPEPPQNSA